MASQAESEPQPKTEPEPEREVLPAADRLPPTDEALQAVNEPRHYRLPPGAILGLTIRDIGLYNVPAINSDSEQAFNSGVVHEPETSLPWSNIP